MLTIKNEQKFVFLESAYIHFEFSLYRPEIINQDPGYKAWKKDLLDNILTFEDLDELDKIAKEEETIQQAFYLLYQLNKKEAFVPAACNLALNYLAYREYVTHFNILDYFAEVY